MSMILHVENPSASVGCGNEKTARNLPGISFKQQRLSTCGPGKLSPTARQIGCQAARVQAARCVVPSAGCCTSRSALKLGSHRSQGVFGGQPPLLQGVFCCPRARRRFRAVCRRRVSADACNHSNGRGLVGCCLDQRLTTYSLQYSVPAESPVRSSSTYSVLGTPCPPLRFRGR